MRMDKMLTVSEVSERLGVTQQRVRQLIAEGRLQSKRYGDKEQFVRVFDSSVSSYAQKRKVPLSVPASAPVASES